MYPEKRPCAADIYAYAACGARWKAERGRNTLCFGDMLAVGTEKCQSNFEFAGRGFALKNVVGSRPRLNAGSTCLRQPCSDQNAVDGKPYAFSIWRCSKPGRTPNFPRSFREGSHGPANFWQDGPIAVATPKCSRGRRISNTDSSPAATLAAGRESYSTRISTEDSAWDWWAASRPDFAHAAGCFSLRRSAAHSASRWPHTPRPANSWVILLRITFCN